MSETTVKMFGLAIMCLSVFAILFGVHMPASAPAWIGPALAWAGFAALIVGLVLYAVVRVKK